jgi:Domain of unknown function (DUF929)
VADHRPGRPARLAWGAVVVILLGVVGLVTYALTHVTSPSAPAQPAVTSPAVLALLSSVPATTFDAIGVTVPRTTLTAPTVASTPALPQIDGKPQVLFVGAEFCPFCAAERWPLVVALARFGRFTALHDTVSSPQTVFPDTPSFSFVGVAYSSPWVSLTGVELYSDQTGPDGTYLRLNRLTPAQVAVVSRATSRSAGVTAGITPFLDIAGRLSTTTSGYSPALLAGQSQAQIAGAVAHPQGPTSPPTGQAVIAVANQLSAGICAATGQLPGRVCRSKGVVAADTALGLSRPVPLPTA